MNKIDFVINLLLKDNNISIKVKNLQVNFNTLDNSVNKVRQTVNSVSPEIFDNITAVNTNIQGVNTSVEQTAHNINILYEEWDKYRTTWEQTRFIAHCSVMPHAKRGLRPTELVEFEWDKENKGEIKAATKEDFERMRGRLGD